MSLKCTAFQELGLSVIALEEFHLLVARNFAKPV